MLKLRQKLLLRSGKFDHKKTASSREEIWTIEVIRILDVGLKSSFSKFFQKLVGNDLLFVITISRKVTIDTNITDVPTRFQLFMRLLKLGFKLRLELAVVFLNARIVVFVAKALHLALLDGCPHLSELLG